MFGLEGQKKKKMIEEFVFELEKDIKNPAKLKEIQEKVNARLHKIKEILHTGDNQEQIDRVSTLLHGYNAILKVIARSIAKKK